MNVSKKFSQGFLCSGCRGPLVVVDTRQAYDVTKGTKNAPRKRTIRKNAQQRLRKYCCINCGKRFSSIEIMNPQYYAIRPLPLSTRKQKFGEEK